MKFRISIFINILFIKTIPTPASINSFLQIVLFTNNQNPQLGRTGNRLSAGTEYSSPPIDHSNTCKASSLYRIKIKTKRQLKVIFTLKQKGI